MILILYLQRNNVVCLDNDGCLAHLIDGDGILYAGCLDHFMKEVNGLSYAVVAIMGPHSSGINLLYFDCHLSLLMCLKNVSFFDREKDINDSPVRD